MSLDTPPGEVTNAHLFAGIKTISDQQVEDGKTLAKLDERSEQHDKRINGVERRAGFIAFVTGLFAALGVNLAAYLGFTPKV